MKENTMSLDPNLVAKKLMPGANKDDVLLFIRECNRSGLDPFSRQIYAIKRGGRYTTQVSIDGARLIAERSGKYQGQAGPFWCGNDGKWVDVWLDKNPPAAAKVGVKREGFSEFTYAVANWSAYCAGGPMWKKMQALMISKVAEMLALRKVFPLELSGLYSSDEMDQAGGTKPVLEEKKVYEKASVSPDVVEVASKNPKKFVAKTKVAVDKATKIMIDASIRQDFPEDPITRKQVESDLRPGEFTITFGKFRGMKINSIDDHVLIGYLEFIKKSAATKRQKLEGTVLEFVTNAESWLA